MVTIRARYPGDDTSDVSAIRFGMAPPSPIPVRKRSTSSCGTELAYAVARAKPPKISVDAMITGLRPTLSAYGPTNSVPTVRPSKPAANTMPKDDAGTRHASASTGAT